MFQDTARVKEQLTEKIKVESLRTYLFSYSSVYDSISLDKLAAMYDLDRSVVHSTVSKMIINEELAVSAPAGSRPPVSRAVCQQCYYLSHLRCLQIHQRIF